MWIVCQLGAREHYAIARALSLGNRLAALCTEYWTGSLGRLAGRMMGGRVLPMASRHHQGLAGARVISWNTEVLGRRLAGERRDGSPYERFLAEGRWFGGRVRGWLERERPVTDCVFSYDTTALEPFEWARSRGIRCILGQMDPGRVEAVIVAEEREKWPGWEATPLVVPEKYHARREAEWNLADRIIVNSKWSRDALIQQGVPEGKLVMVPLVYEKTEDLETEDRRQEGRGWETGGRGRDASEGTESSIADLRSLTSPLKVLFLGQVNLRKGIPYLMEAARLLDPAKVEIDVVGPLQISEHARAGAPRNLRFHGPVNRGEVAARYARADVFVLPTLSDGFALTQLEAMAHGLPVITTPHCGEVVTDGEDGRIVPARDPAALAEAILALANDRDRLAIMSLAAIGKSRQFTLDRLASYLNQI